MSKKSEITIVIDGKQNRVSIASLITVISNVVAMLRSISRELGDDLDSPITWNITRTQKNSPLEITLAPSSRKRPYLGKRVVREYVQGIRVIENSSTCPESFSDKAIDSAKKMVSVLQDGVKAVRFVAPDVGEARATLHLAANVDVLRSKMYRYETTTFRGILEDVRTHDEANVFEMYDPLTSQKITCHFKAGCEKAVGELLTRRVFVYGRAKFDRKDNPMSIEVEQFRGIREPHELPKISETPPVDITGGVDSVEYVRRIRSGDGL